MPRANRGPGQLTPVLRHGGPDTGVAWRLLAVDRSLGSYVREVAEQARCKSDAGTLYLRRLREWAWGAQSQSF